MINLPDPRNLLAAALLGMLIGSLSGSSAAWWFRGVLADRVEASIRADSMAAQQAIADEAAAAAADARRKQADWAAKAAASDRKHTEEMTNAQQEIERLRAADRAGDVRLSVAATCPPAGGGGMPGAAGAAGVGDAGAPQLTADARAAYFDLRASIAGTEVALKACQGYINSLPIRR